jgi:hypothetical protein
VPDPLQELLAAGALPKTSFPPTSRYADIDVTAYDPGDGRAPIPYLRRRLCPAPARFALLYEVMIVEGDRRDLLAARHVGDPELWWRLADANASVDPRELTDRVGDRIRITLGEGIPGASDE